MTTISEEITLIDNEFRKTTVQKVGDFIYLSETGKLGGESFCISLDKSDFNGLVKIVENLFK